MTWRRSYNEAFAASNRIVAPQVIAGATSTWAQYTLQVEDRAKFQADLKAAGVPTAVYYPIPLSCQKAYAHYPSAPGTPVSEALALRVVSLAHASISGTHYSRPRHRCSLEQRWMHLLRRCSWARGSSARYGYGPASPPVKSVDHWPTECASRARGGGTASSPPCWQAQLIKSPANP